MDFNIGQIRMWLSEKVNSTLKLTDGSSRDQIAFSNLQKFERALEAIGDLNEYSDTITALVEGGDPEHRLGDLMSNFETLTDFSKKMKEEQDNISMLLALQLSMED